MTEIIRKANIEHYHQPTAKEKPTTAYLWSFIGLALFIGVLMGFISGFIVGKGIDSRDMRGGPGGYMGGNQSEGTWQGGYNRGVVDDSTNT